jgi:hypothetical protein
LTAQTLAAAAQQPGRTGILSIFRNLSADEWGTMALQLLPPEITRALTDDVVAQTMAYLSGDRESVVLNLTVLKAHLQSPQGVDAVYAMLKTQPDCTLEQLSAMVLNQQALTLCNPPETFLLVNLRPVVEAEIRSVMLLIPEQVTLISAGPNRLQTLRNLNALRFFMRWSPLLPVMCLLIITILAVRSLKSWLAWWGTSLLSAGLTSMFLSALSGPLAALTFQVFIAPFIPGAFPADIVDVFKGLTAVIVRHALQPVLLWAGIMVLLGTAMLTAMFLFRGRFQRGQVDQG